MATLRSIENQNPFALKANPSIRTAGIRKPLRGVGNKTRNMPVKASFSEKPSLLAAKENVLKSKLAKPTAVREVKKEVLQNVIQLQESLPVLDSFSTLQIPENVLDIDKDDAENPQLVSCYINEIYMYLRAVEAQFPVAKCHLQRQTDINPKMRAVLIDWLVQVHMRFHMLQETLYMAISIMDRYLQCEKVKRSQLQCVGVASMFIAAKYEEMYAPDVADFVYITDNAYSKQDIFNTEKAILKRLDFNISKPLPLHFLRRNSKAACVDSTIHALAKYVMELTLPEYELASAPPSLLGAAALYLSMRLLCQQLPWSETLRFYSGYAEQDILPTVQVLCRVVAGAEKSKLQAIRSKYASAKLLKVSTIPELKSPIITEFAASK